MSYINYNNWPFKDIISDNAPQWVKISDFIVDDVTSSISSSASSASRYALGVSGRILIKNSLGEIYYAEVIKSNRLKPGMIINPPILNPSILGPSKLPSTSGDTILNPPIFFDSSVALSDDHAIIKNLVYVATLDNERYDSSTYTGLMCANYNPYYDYENDRFF